MEERRKEGYEQGRWGTKLEQERLVVGRGPHSPSQDAIDMAYVIHTAWWGGLLLRSRIVWS